MASPKSQKELRQEAELNALLSAISLRGIKVRRENLSRGYSFRVKSGNCYFSGDNLLFVDRRLSLEQQLSLALDFILERQIDLSSEEISPLSPKARTLLEGRLKGTTSIVSPA